MKCYVLYKDGSEEVFENVSFEVTPKWVIVQRDEKTIAALAADQVARIAETEPNSTRQIVSGAGREETERWCREHAIPLETPRAA